jgi:hypothetical protein
MYTRGESKETVKDFLMKFADESASSDSGKVSPQLIKPALHKVLCFQHLRSRVSVTVREFKGPLLTSMALMPAASGSKTKHATPFLFSRWEELGAQSETKELPSEPHARNIVSWQYCKLCKAEVTPRRYLSQSSGRLSFAKFLDLFLTCPLACNNNTLHNYLTRGESYLSHNLSAGNPETSSCNHPVFQSHLFCFAKNQMVVGVEHSQVVLYPLFVQPKNFIGVLVDKNVLSPVYERKSKAICDKKRKEELSPDSFGAAEKPAFPGLDGVDFAPVVRCSLNSKKLRFPEGLLL